MNLATQTVQHLAALKVHRFAPGDLVIRYVNEEPFVCMVVGLEGTDQLRVTCTTWPSGYNALVHARDVVRLAYPNP